MGKQTAQSEKGVLREDDTINLFFAKLQKYEITLK